jgi:septal ring factor EnvC (AmiA/AmiB activator)
VKFFLSLLSTLLLVSPIYAEQALILTELEQVQEKIWYLQRDVAAQKTSIEKQLEEIKQKTLETNLQQVGTEQRLDALADLLNSQHDRSKQIETNLQSLKEAVTALVNEFNQQNTAQLQQAQKSGTQEGLLQALREEVASNQKDTAATLAETRQQLAETRAQLAALQQQEGNNFDRMGLYLGGAALALAILLAVGFAFLNSMANRSSRGRTNRTTHEL